MESKEEEEEKRLGYLNIKNNKVIERKVKLSKYFEVQQSYTKHSTHIFWP